MARVLGLIVGAVLVWLCTLPVAPVAHAVTYEQALAACASKNAIAPPGRIITQVCIPAAINPCSGASYGGYRVITVGKAPPNYPDCYVWNTTSFDFSGCAATAGQTAVVRLPKYYESPGPFYATLPGTPCQCTFYMRASWQDTAFGGPGLTLGQCTATGRMMGDDGEDGDPPVTVDGPSAPPNPCDGGGLSCYDAAGNQWCYGSGGTQVCVDGPGGPADPDPGATPPACAQGDGVAICAGTPDAPQPQPAVDGDPIGDEDVSTSDGAGAPPSNTNVIIWDTTGQGNNKDPGDGSSGTGSTGNGGNNGSEGGADGTGKCADGSVPSASGCGAGYTDHGCDAPPTCSGDALMCAGLREQHATRCAAAKRAADFSNADQARADLTAAGLPAEPGEPNGDDLVKTVEVGDDSGDGTSLDASGYGYAVTCPIHPVTFTLAGQTVGVDYSKACEYLDLGGWIVLILSYRAAARIISEGK